VPRKLTSALKSQLSALKSVPSLAQRAPSSVTLRFAQGKPSVHPRLISFATLTAGLRSIFALSCFVSSQVSALSPQVSSLSSQPSALSPQLSALKSLPPLLDELQFAAIDQMRQAIASHIGIEAFGL
jgi:hypothetical protein